MSKSFINQKEVLLPFMEDDIFSRVIFAKKVYDSTLKRNSCLGECRPKEAYKELARLLQKYNYEAAIPQTYCNFCTELNEYFLNVWGTAYTLFEMGESGRGSAEFISIPYWPFEYSGSGFKLIINEKAPFYEVKRVMHILMGFQEWCLNTHEYDTEMVDMEVYKFGHYFRGIEEAYDCFNNNIVKSIERKHKSKKYK